MKSLLQTKEWAHFRQNYGWQSHWIDDTLILEKKLPFDRSFLYAPEVDFFALDLAKNLPKIKEIAKNSQAIFIRLEFLNRMNTLYSEKIIDILKNYHFIKAFEEIQPEYRQIINLTKTEEQILAQMKSKGRYNIRLAKRHGVVIEKSENISDFYEIFRETAKRDGFQIRPQKYFEDLLKILKEKSFAELLVAKYHDKITAAGIFCFYEETASYLYGASSSEDREVMAPYLLHWEAIKLAKAKDCKIYDLLAISPLENNSDLISKDRKLIAKYAGITRFKEQFGGRKVQIIGSYDLVLKSGWYKMFKIIEKVRRR